MTLLDTLRDWPASIRDRLSQTSQPQTAGATITDAGPWEQVLISGGGPADRPWYGLARDMDDALDAWRQNFLMRQVVRLTTSYVVGDGINIRARHRHAAGFVTRFWAHRQNRIDLRLSAWCDELTRSGELFIALFTNPADGMSYVRAVPARQIVRVETDPEDYEKETGYIEQQNSPLPPGEGSACPHAPPGTVRENLPPGQRRWSAFTQQAQVEVQVPVLLHYTINKPVGATRGESDLTPILPWGLRYTQWLKDRVRHNQLRTELAAAWIKVQDDTQIEKKRRQYAANPPTGGNIFVTGPGEELAFPSAAIEAADASADGQAMRLAVAAGANIPLHFLAEGTSATRSTAKEMGDPSRRHYRMRQIDFGHILTDLAEKAYLRHAGARGKRAAGDPALTAEMPDVSREDNQSLAAAASSIVDAFATMKDQGWIDNETAIRLAFKFAGEVLTDKQMAKILAESPRW